MAAPSEPEPRSVAARPELPPDDAPVYSAAFWVAYVANVAVVTANALTFRFAELVDFLGGREKTAGAVVGVATAFALLCRLPLGQAIDRYGVRRLWMASAAVFVAGGALLTFADSLSWTLYLARTLFAVGLAGNFTCSAVHIQNLVPPHRRTEILGSLGSSGFLGMILGPLIGDAIFDRFDGRARFVVLFGSSLLLGATYLAILVFLTRGERHVRPGETPGVHKLAFRYWPGNVILVACVMGLMLAVTTVFLTRFATHRGIGLGPFFAGYGASAFAFRVLSRNWSRTVGRHRMILLGLAGHTVAMLLLPFVSREWEFAIPAAFGGFGHALLFPAVVSLGSERFPREYRGTGTTLVLGFFDVGTFASAPLLGAIIDAFDRTGFTPMFLAAAAVAVGVSVLYRFTGARRPDSDLIAPVAPVLTPSFADVPSARGRFAGETSTASDVVYQRSAPERMDAGYFACEGTSAEPSAREASGSQIFAGDGYGPHAFATEGSTRGPSAREGSDVESPASEGSARGSSAREGNGVVTPSASRPPLRASITGATRCR